MACATVGLLLATTVPAGAAGTSANRYQVRRGDTLSGIASRLGVTVGALASGNGLADPDVVISGRWLHVPAAGASDASSGGSTHRVVAGETLSGIASAFGLATATLAGANGIADADVVIAGTTLRIPAAGGSSANRATGDVGSLPRRLRQTPSRLALMPVFDQWANAYGVPPDLLKAVTWLESGWQQGVVSSTGAVGIGQLMPSTVETVNDLMGTNLSVHVPAQNIRMSARYLSLLLSVTGRNTSRTLAGYYQGLASVAANGLYPSTLAYIAGVTTLRARFR